MPRLTLKTTFVVAVTAVALFQLVAVTLASLPPNRYTDAAAPHSTYLSPMFAQNWRLFAPNPVSEDRTIEFQGSYRDANGTIKQTEWVDWTAVELDLVHHRLVGGRAGYITNKLFSPLGSRYAGLTRTQKSLADSTRAADPPSWADLSKELLTEAPNRPDSTSTYLRYERATIQLATGVLQARWPERKFVAVHYSLNRQGVVPYHSRNRPEADREAARPPMSVRVSGWRVPELGSAAERRTIADFDRRHR